MRPANNLASVVVVLYPFHLQKGSIPNCPCSLTIPYSDEILLYFYQFYFLNLRVKGLFVYCRWWAAWYDLVDAKGRCCRLTYRKLLDYDTAFPLQYFLFFKGRCWMQFCSNSITHPSEGVVVWLINKRNWMQCCSNSMPYPSKGVVVWPINKRHWMQCCSSYNPRSSRSVSG